MRGEALLDVSVSVEMFRDNRLMTEFRKSTETMLFNTLSSSLTSPFVSRLKSKCETSILLRLKNMFSLKLFDIKLEFRSKDELSKAFNFEAEPFWLFVSALGVDLVDRILSMLLSFSLSFSNFCLRLKSLFSNVFCSSCVKLSLTCFVCSSWWITFFLCSICLLKMLMFSLYSSSNETLKEQESRKWDKDLQWG